MKSRRSVRQNLGFLIVLVAVVVIAAVWSTLLIVAPGQQTLDTRVQRVASQLKCLICQGESVADSPSPLAQQMRATVREQLQSGRSEQDVIQYFEQRYGAQIVWSPPWRGFSLLAWLVPIVFLLCGIVLIILLLREWRSNIVGTVPCACPPVGQRTEWVSYVPPENGQAQGTVPTDYQIPPLESVREGGTHANQTGSNEPPTRFRAGALGIVQTCGARHTGYSADSVPTVGGSQDDDLERYRAQLEAELAADDVLFRKTFSARRAVES